MNKKEITKEWGKLEKTIYEDSDFSIEITEIYKDNNGIERRYITTRDKNIKDFYKYKEIIDSAINYLEEQKNTNQTIVDKTGWYIRDKVYKILKGE